MWIKGLHIEIHNIVTINIHNRSFYFKIITCIILGLVISYVFACKTNSVLVILCTPVYLASTTTRGRAVCETGELEATDESLVAFGSMIIL